MPTFEPPARSTSSGTEGSLPMVHLRDALIATQFLTRLPIPARLQTDWGMEDLRSSVHMFPIVGLLIGLGASLVYAAAVFCNLPPVIAAVLAVTVQVLIIGGLHEDGLADVCDGFGGGQTREKKLEIMRDSRLGTYGAIGLVLSLALRIAAITHLASPDAVAAGLIAAAALSRAAMPIAMWLMPQARPEGLAASTGRPERARVLLGLGLGVLIVGLSLPFLTAVLIIAASMIVTWGFLILSRSQSNGITGDVLGCLQQLLEITALSLCTALVF